MKPCDSQGWTQCSHALVVFTTELAEFIVFIVFMLAADYRIVIGSDPIGSG